jgi:hypothetical protein
MVQLVEAHKLLAAPLTIGAWIRGPQIRSHGSAAVAALPVHECTCGGFGPNPRIKSGLLGRTARSTCTNVPGICPERTQCTRSRPVLVPRVGPRHPRQDPGPPSHSVTEAVLGERAPSRRYGRRSWCSCSGRCCTRTGRSVLGGDGVPDRGPRGNLHRAGHMGRS